jgi:hypothetical protein
MNRSALAPFLLSVFLAASNALAEEPPLGEIHGTLMINGKEPAAYANLVIVGTRRGTQVDDRGEFRVTKIPPGLCVIRVMYPGMEPVADTLRLSAGESRELHLVLDAPWLLPGWPKQHARAVRLGSDCDHELGDQAQYAPVSRLDAENPSGRFSLSVPQTKAWKLIAGYKLPRPDASLSIVVRNNEGRIVRTLRSGPGSRAASVDWDLRNDAGNDFVPGRYVIEFSTPTDTLRLGCCLRASVRNTIEL